LWIAALCAEAEANAKQSVTAPTNPFGSFFPFLSPWQSEPQSFAKRKGLWVGGPIPLGCATVNKKLIIVPEEAETVRTMFRLYLECGSVGALAEELFRRNIVPKVRSFAGGRTKLGNNSTDVTPRLLMYSTIAVNLFLRRPHAHLTRAPARRVNDGGRSTGH